MNRSNLDLEKLLSPDSELPKFDCLIKDVHEGSQRLTVGFIPLHRLDADLIVSFVCKLVASRNTNVFAIEKIIRVLLIRVRKLLCRHTRRFRELYAWDSMCYEILTGLVFKCNPDPTWKRLCKQTIRGDLNRKPFDGSAGMVVMTYELMNRLVIAAEDADFDLLNAHLENKIDTSCSVLPQLMTIATLNNWTLLHYAAAMRLTSRYPEELSRLLIRAGAGVIELDSALRTPLHIAAGALNYHVILLLCSVDYSARKMRDRDGFRPIETLLRAISISRWRDRLTSQQLGAVIKALIPENEVEMIWNCTMHGGGVEVDPVVHPRSCLLYHAIAFSDDLATETVMKLAIFTPNRLWSYDVIKECIRASVKSNRLPTVNMLISDFLVMESIRDNSEDVESFQQSWLAFLNHLMCVAITHKALKVLVSLIDRFNVEVERVVNMSTTPVSTALAQVSFMHVAVLKGDASTLRTVVSLLNRDALVYLLYVSTVLPDSNLLGSFAASTPPSIDATEGTTEEMQAAAAAASPHSARLTPLSVLCYLGSVEGVQICLGASLPSVKGRQLAVEGSTDASEHWSTVFVQPLLHCLLSNNMKCLQLLRNVLGVGEFSRLCFCADVNGSTVFDIFLRHIVQGTQPLQRHRDMQCLSSSLLRQFDRLTGYSVDMLKLMLESIPESLPRRNAGHLLNSRDSSESDTFGSYLADINTRLSAVFSAVITIPDSLPADAYHPTHTVQTLDRPIDKESRLFVTASTLYEESRSSWSALENSVNSKYFLNCLRILTKSFTPDKTWLRLAACLNVLLQPQVTPTIKDKIDLSCWSEFHRTLVHAQKANNSKGFLNKLLLGSGHVHNFDLVAHPLTREVYDAVEKLYTDKSIFVVHSTKAPDLPHFMTASNERQDDRIRWMLRLFTDLVGRVMADKLLVLDLLPQMVPCKPPPGASLDRGRRGVLSTNVNLTLQQYFNGCYLLQLRDYVMSLASRRAVVDSVLNIVLQCNPPDAEESHAQPMKSLIANGLKLGALDLDAFPHLLLQKSDRRSTHRVAQHFHSVISILIEHSLSLGYTCESLLQHLLPLCALKEWRHVSQILSLCLERQQLLSEDELGHALQEELKMLVETEVCTHTFVSQQPLYGAAALRHYEAIHALGLGLEGDTPVLNVPLKSLVRQVCSVTPLHFAVYYRQPQIISLFYQLFPTYKANLTSLVSFAMETQSSDMCLKILENAVYYQHNAEDSSVLKSLLQSETRRTDAKLLSLRTSRGLSPRHCTDVEFGQKVADLVEKALSLSGQYARANSASVASVRKALHPFAGQSGVTSSGISVEVAPRAGDNNSSRTGGGEIEQEEEHVALLDGSSVPLSQFMTEPMLVARALPAPQTTLGLLNTGHSFLHVATLLPESTIAEQLARRPEWCQKALTVDYVGATPVFNAISSGHFELASQMLSRLNDGKNGKVTASAGSVTDLYVAHCTKANQQTSSRLPKLIVARAKQSYEETTKRVRLSLSGYRMNELGITKYGVIPDGPECLLDLLAQLMRHVEVSWQALTQQDFTKLVKLSHQSNNSSSELSSIVRARQILSVIGIPFSQLGGRNFSASTKNVMSKSAFGFGLKDFENLSVSKLSANLSLTAANQIRSILCSWYLQRNGGRSIPVQESFMLFRCAEDLFTATGLYGGEILPHIRASGLLRRGTGISYDHLNTYATLCNQISMELRHSTGPDFYYGARENNTHLRISHGGGSVPFDSKVTATSKVQAYLETMNIDAQSLQETLRLSYRVLEFGRLLYVCRTLAMMTNHGTAAADIRSGSRPSAAATVSGVTGSVTSEVVLHPLDQIVEETKQRKENLNRMKYLLDIEEVNGNLVVNPKGMAIPGGMNDRIKVCDFIQFEDLVTFCTLKCEPYHQLYQLRRIVLDGLSAVLTDTSSHNLCEFLSRMCLCDFEFTEADHANTVTQMTNKTMPFSRFKRYTSVKEGLSAILQKITEYKVSDFLPEDDATATSKFPSTDRFYEMTIHKINSLLPAKYLAKNKGCIVPTLEELQRIEERCAAQLSVIHPPSTQLSHGGLKEFISAHTSESQQFKDDGTKYRLYCEAVDLWKRAYRAGTDLYWFLMSILGLMKTNHARYQCDIQCFVKRALELNPMIELCTAQTAAPTTNDGKSTVDASIASSSKVDCLRHLLRLGFDPAEVNSKGLCPLASAALCGQPQLLEVMLMHCLETSNTLDKARKLKYGPYLVWHVLMESPHIGHHHTLQSSERQSAVHFQEVVLLLLRFGFSAQSPESADYSCLDLACLKHMEEVVLALCEGNKAATTERTSYSEQFLSSRQPPAPASSDASMRVSRNTSLLSFKACHALLLWRKVPIKLLQLVFDRLSEGDASLLGQSVCLERQFNSEHFRKEVIVYHEGMMMNLGHCATPAAVAAAADPAEVGVNSLKLIREAVMDLMPVLDDKRRQSCLVTFDGERLCSRHSTAVSAEKGHLPTVYSMLTLLMAACCRTKTSSKKLISTLLERFSVSWSELLSDFHRNWDQLLEIVCLACFYNCSMVLHSIVKQYSGDATSDQSQWLYALFNSSVEFRLLNKTLSPLEIAVEMHSSECVAVLLSGDVDVEVNFAVKVIVHSAVSEEAMLSLLKYAIERNFSSSVSALHDNHAAPEVDDPLVAFLECLRFYDNTDNTELLTGESLLHLCCRRGHTRLVEYLLSLGADPMLQDASGTTALQNSIASGYCKITRMMYSKCPTYMHEALSLMAYAIRKRLLQRVIRK